MPNTTLTELADKLHRAATVYDEDAALAHGAFKHECEDIANLLRAIASDLEFDNGTHIDAASRLADTVLSTNFVVVG